MACDPIREHHPGWLCFQMTCWFELFGTHVPSHPMWLIRGFSLPKEEAHTAAVLLIGIHKEARSQVLHLSRNKRYTLTPEQLKWDKFKLTYKY